MTKKQKYKIIIASSDDLEELASEIYFENELLATVTREDGLKHAKIEIWPKEDKTNWALDFNNFIEIAKDALQELDY